MLRRLAAVALGVAVTTAAGGPLDGRVPLSQSLSFAGAPTLGDPNAPVVLVEFSDFHCPFCRTYARTTFPEIKKAFVDTGRVLYAFRHYPLDTHPRAPDAAVAAFCAARQGRFWELHERLFAAPSPVAPDALEGHARAAGVDLRAWRTCVRAGVAREDVRQEVEEARRIGFAGTPGFVAGYRDGADRLRPRYRLAGAQPIASFTTMLEELLKGR
jgi:protein-disulfide isomerase